MTSPLVQTIGRRKRAVARVRVKDGTGSITVNGRTLENFFPSDTHRMIITEPLRMTSTDDSYDIDATNVSYTHLRAHETPEHVVSRMHR